MDSIKPISIAGYVRVSGLQQVKFGSSLAEQRKAIETYAKAYGCTIYQIYADEGFSGAASDRPAMTRMKDDAPKGLFQKVIFSCLDRFGRSASNTLSDYTYFEELGISLHSIREGLDTSTPMGKLFRTILAGAAEMERERIRERFLIGALGRLEKGLRIGLEPFGYLWNAEKQQFEIEPEHAEIYKHIIYDYLIEKKKQIQIAIELNEKGIKTKRGKKWGNSTIRTILRNPSYKGICCYNFQGRRFDLPSPPLIDRETWEEIQNQMQRRAPRNRKANEANYHFFLKDLMQCNECNSRIRPMLVRNGKTRRYYGCSIATMGQVKRRSSNIEKSCFLPSMPAEDVENVIMNEIQKYFRDQTNLKTLWFQRVDMKRKGEIREKMDEEKNQRILLQKKRNHLWDLFNEDFIDKAELIKGEGVLSESIQALKERSSTYQKELAFIEARHEEIMYYSQRDLDRFRFLLEDRLKLMSKCQLGVFLREIFKGNKIRLQIVQIGDPIGTPQGENLENGFVFIPRRRRTRGVVGWKVTRIHGLDMKAAYQYLMPFIEGERGKIFDNKCSGRIETGAEAVTLHEELKVIDSPFHRGDEF